MSNNYKLLKRFGLEILITENIPLLFKKYNVFSWVFGEGALGPKNCPKNIVLIIIWNSQNLMSTRNKKL